MLWKRTTAPSAAGRSSIRLFSTPELQRAGRRAYGDAKQLSAESTAQR